MENYSYYTFHGVNCILIEREDRISLIPCNKEDLSILFRNMQDRDFEIKYEVSIDKCSFAHINYKFNEFERVDLYPDYIVHSWHPKACAIEITGQAVDDFFSPATYFYYERIRENKNYEIIYDYNEADKWRINYNGSELKITLYYGNILRKGSASDLMLHPRLKIEFEETDDFKLIYEIYKAIKRFFIFILYKKECGRFNVELFTMIGEKFSHIGQLRDISLKDAKYNKQYGRICYSDYKEYVPSILQFIFDNPSLYLKHLPEYEILERERDIELLHSQLFAAFESEYKMIEKNNKSFNVDTNTSKIESIKNKLLHTVDELYTDENEYTEDEKTFIEAAKQRILQLGTQLGQKEKIIKTYKLLSTSIDSHISYILYKNKQYRYVDKLTEEQINSIAKQLTSLRGAIVHGGKKKDISQEDRQLITFFEVIIYAQMLYRAKISNTDIKMIIGTSFFHKFDLMEKTMKNLDNKKVEQ